MKQPVLYVLVNNTFKPGMSMSQLADCTMGNWPVTVAYVAACEVVVPVFHHLRAGYDHQLLAAWRIDDVFAITAANSRGKEERYDIGLGRTSARTGMKLGDQLPMLFRPAPALRRGVGRIL